MKLNMVNLQKELFNCDESQNTFINTDSPQDSVIFNQLYLPLSKDKAVPFSQISLEQFNYSDICDFINMLMENSRKLNLQDDWVNGVSKFNPCIRQTKAFF